MAADLQYTATLDNKQVLAALKQIDAAITKQTTEASKNFQQLGKSAQQSGVEIGAMSGIVSSLTTAFINLGQQAVTALIDIGKQSVQTAIEVDTLKARLGGIFSGSKEAATEAFTFIQDKSRELGIDLSELAGAFLPKTESLAQFERVAKIATALARSDPEQGAIGARIALIEALSGSFSSLQKRFEIPKDDINALKEAFDKKGIEGFLEAFEGVLAESGKSFEDFANTASTSFAKLEISGQQLGGRLGAPILEALQNAAEKINDFIGANEEDLIVFADTIGRAIADAINFISSLDLSQLDTSQLIQVADYIFSITKALEIAGTQVVTFFETFSQFPGVSQIIQGLSYELQNLDDALLTLSQIFALINASVAGLVATFEPLNGLFSALASAASGDFAGAGEQIAQSLADTADNLGNGTAAQEAFNASILASAQQFADYDKALQGNKDSQQSLREELEQTATAGTDAADAILAQKQAAIDAEKANSDYEEALAKVNEKFAEAEQDLNQKLEDIDIETARKRFDILEDFANKREDLARDNARRLEDIARETEQKLQDAAIDLNRTEQDIALKFTRQQADLARQQAQKRIDIEVEYRRKLKDIRRQFNQDADEAEKNRDAVSFLKALKQRNEEITQAQIERQQAINDTRLEGERKREELRISQEQEIEDARIANERKIEDIKLFNQRAIEENQTRLDREQEDLAIAEARKLEELELNRQRDIEDAQKAYERKIADLEQSLAAELALIQEYEQAKRDEFAATAEAAAASGGGTPAEEPSTTAGAAAGFGSNPGTITGNSLDEFASGGIVPGPKGKPRVVIAHGGETIIPTNSPLLMPVGGSSGGNSYTFNNQKSASLGGLLDPGSLDALLASKIENVLLNVLNKVS